jgi:hypothetical protein
MTQLRALVVFESAFGNTEEVARAIAVGLEPRFQPEVVAVADAPASVDQGVDLLVIGAPTHALGLSRPNTREQATAQGGRTSTIGVREWLESLEAPPGIAAAAFDTRIVKPWVLRLTGTASRAAARRLRKRGFRVVARESFVVVGTQGPLREGERERAREWAATLAASAQPRSGARPRK